MRGPVTEGDGWLWRAAKLLVLAATVVVAVLLLWRLSHVLLLVFGSILIAVLLRAAASPIARFTPIPDRWSVVLATLVIAAALVGLIVLTGRQFLSELALLLETLPDLVDAAENRWGIDGLGDWLDRQRLAVLEPGGLAVNVASYSTTLFSVGAQLLVVLSGGVYLALHPQGNLEGFLKLVPKPRQDRARDTLETVGRALRLWLLGQLASMVLIGALVTLGLTLLGIPSALALGVIAGLFEFVPLVGPVASAVPSVVVGLGQGPTTALWVVGLYVVIQQAESVLITPLVQQYTVDLPPIVTIFALIAFGALFGALGLLLATPLAVVCLVLVTKLWVREVVEEEVTVPGEGTPDAAS